jgi:DNA-binding MarR family transcriptional regulator
VSPTRPPRAAPARAGREPGRRRPEPPPPLPPATPHQACAARLVALVPQWMREIRTEMRAAATPSFLSVPAFRVLIFARYFPGGSLSELAAHHGVTLPTASVSVERLVEQGLLESREVPANRRRRALHLTRAGRRLVDGAMSHTTDVFAARLADIGPAELARVMRALDTLERVLVTHPDPDPDTPADDAGAQDPSA